MSGLDKEGRYVREIISTLRDRGSPDGRKRRCQKLYMRRLVLGDFFQVIVERGVEAGGGELGLGEVQQTLAVEGGFEVFKGEGVVEDGDVAAPDGAGLALGLGKGTSCGDGTKKGSGEQVGLHCDYDYWIMILARRSVAFGLRSIAK